MADSKISALTSGNPAQSGDEIPIARGGANYKITAGSIASLGGDVDGPASSVDNQIALFDSTTGKLIKAATTTGVLKASSGVIAAATSGTDYVAPAGAFSGLSWQSVQTTGFTAVAFRAYPCNTTSAAFTVTLPASPSAGDQITLTDYAGTFGTNFLTINPNGGKIRGSTDNAVISTSNNSVQLVYIDSTKGWLVYAAVSSTPFAPPTSSIDYLIVAGGGGGGSGDTGAFNGGGGGAGGYRTATALSVTAGTVYTIAVGGAGSGQTAGNIRGTSGSDSYIQGTGIAASPAAPGNPYANAITSFGGGGGGAGSAGTTTGINGGSGGGGGTAAGATTGGTGNTPNTSPSQGNNGAGGTGAPNYLGGGGGGANAAASTANRNGGAGQTGPSFASGFGVSGVFAGGGGGGGGGTGGSGGGGNGASTTASTAGATNTGGGGGGGTWDTGGKASAAGGSGVVIIAYPATYAAAAATTGSPTVTISGGNRIYAFTGNGSITF